MRFALAMILIAVALTGCSSLSGKKPEGAAAPTGPGTPPPKFPTSADPIINSTAAVPGRALIAGTVLDEYGRPAPNSYIRLVAVSEKEATPQEIEAPQGYFTIDNLKPGIDYKLIARTKVGERLIAGQAQTSAPNSRIVIRMSRDLVGATTPEIPPHVGDTRPPKKTSSLGDPIPAPPDWKGGGAPKADALTTGTIEPHVPAVKVPSPSDPPKAVVPPGPGVVDRGGAWPPTLDIAPRTPDIKPVPPLEKSDAPARPGGTTTLGPARVPSCVLVGKQLINLALNDINGEAWEFRSQKKGKLILLDFWGTECIPCRKTLPVLKELDLKYRGQGLEVIGIAYETSGTPQEKGYRVNAVVQSMNITYRQLLGAAYPCPVGGQFSVRAIPTLVLLDENGWILWRHEGILDAVKQDELERWLQRRLPRK